MEKTPRFEGGFLGNTRIVGENIFICFTAFLRRFLPFLFLFGINCLI